MSNDRPKTGSCPAAPLGPSRNTLDTDGMLSEWSAAVNRNCRKLWEERAAGRGQLIRQRPTQRTSARALAVWADAIKAWEQIAVALARSRDPEDVRLAVEGVRYLSKVASGGQEAARLVTQSARQPEDERFYGAEGMS